MASPPSTPNQTSRIDPIRDRYFRSLELAEACTNWIFWVVAVLSILALSLDRATNAPLYDGIQTAFVAGVLALFVVGLGVRLYWTPRAEDKRRQSLLSDSFNVALIHEQVVGYYNNSETNSVKRLGASLLENSFFSKSILLTMARGERFRMGLYVLVWLIALFNRATDLALVAAMAQAIFSEQLISRWVRLEWIRNRVEHGYDKLYQLFQTTTDYDRDEFRVRVLAEFGDYETGKGYGGILLSKKIFERRNAELSAEWAQIRARLGI